MRNLCMKPALTAVSLLCALAAPTVVPANDTTIVPGKRIGPVALGMTKDAVHRLLGRPTSTEPADPKRGTQAEVWSGAKGFLRVVYSNGSVAQIETSRAQDATADALRPGMAQTVMAGKVSGVKRSRAIGADGQLVSEYWENDGSGLAEKITVQEGDAGVDIPVGKRQVAAIIVFRPGTSVTPNYDEQMQASAPARGAGGAPSPKIAMELNGALLVQPLSGGPPIPASEQEKRIWAARKAKEEAYEGPVKKSPDGKYEAVSINSEGFEGQYRGEVEPFQNSGVIIRRSADKKVVFCPKDVALIFPKEDGEWIGLDFYEWLPGGRYAIMGERNHVAGWNAHRRIGFDLMRGKPTAFNGWLAPNGRDAIILSPVAGGKEETSRLEERDTKGEKLWEYTGPDFYLAKVPANLSGYSFQKVPKKPIVADGKRLRVESVEFSPDGRYALVGAIVSKKKYSGLDHVECVIDFRTGTVRKINADMAGIIGVP